MGDYKYYIEEDDVTIDSSMDKDTPATIKSVSVKNQNGEVLTMHLAYPYSDDNKGLAVTSIDGLGPGEAVINLADNSILDGGRLTSKRIPSRSITLSLKFVPRYYDYFTEDEKIEYRRNKLNGTLTEEMIERFKTRTIQDCRETTYRYFPLKSAVSLYFVTRNGLRTIKGYVESNTPTMFDSEVGTDIAISCPDPYFYDEKKTNATVDPGEIIKDPRFSFSFPTSDSYKDESYDVPLSESGDLQFIFGYVKTRDETEEDRRYKTLAYVEYPGSEDSGCIITIHIGHIDAQFVSEHLNPDTSDPLNMSIINRFMQGSNAVSDVMRFDLIRIIKIITGVNSRDDGDSGFYHMANGDRIIINTNDGKKAVRYYSRARTRYYNILGALPIDSKWIKLNHGGNYMSVDPFTIDGHDDYSIAKYVKMSVEYKNRYEGV